jgi:hypothetical protein
MIGRAVIGRTKKESNPTYHRPGCFSRTIYLRPWKMLVDVSKIKTDFLKTFSDFLTLLHAMASVTDNGPLEVSEQDERVYRHITLANKLQVLLISDPETDKASACLDTKVLESHCKRFLFYR